MRNQSSTGAGRLLQARQGHSVAHARTCSTAPAPPCPAAPATAQRGRAARSCRCAPARSAGSGWRLATGGAAQRGQPQAAAARLLPSRESQTGACLAGWLAAAVAEGAGLGCCWMTEVGWAAGGSAGSADALARTRTGQPLNVALKPLVSCQSPKAPQQVPTA